MSESYIVLQLEVGVGSGGEHKYISLNHLCSSWGSYNESAFCSAFDFYDHWLRPMACTWQDYICLFHTVLPSVPSSRAQWACLGPKLGSRRDGI